MKFQEQHKIEIFLTCEHFALVQEAAQITGCGDDLERYVKSIIAERC